MAITPAACQTQLGTNPQNAQIIRADELVGTTLKGGMSLGWWRHPVGHGM